jgi:flagellar basal-body rod modification protein FlgD
MEISGITDLAGVTQTAGKKTLDKEDFMMLLMKQLSYQDPLNPMDSTEFTTQLTQFSSLEELNNINSTLEDVLSFQNSMQNAAVADLIGKTVKISGDDLSLNGTATVDFKLLGDASSVKINIMDSSGKLVWSKDLGAQQAGNLTYVWDGQDLLGNQAADGTYTFEIQATDQKGNPVELKTRSSGTVTGISFDNGVTYLVLDSGRRALLSEIQTIE